MVSTYNMAKRKMAIELLHTVARIMSNKVYQINALWTVNGHFQSFSHVEVNILTAFAYAFVLDLQNLAACLVLDHKSSGNIDNEELTTCTWLSMLYFSVLWILKNNNLVEQLRL